MKKLFICLVIAFTAVCANAQVTWNVRAGGGIQSIVDDGEYFDVDDIFVPTLTIETNIPLKSGSAWTFSPSVSIGYALDYGIVATMPLHMGYKIPIGRSTLFCPKAGAIVGYIEDAWGSFLLGPSIEIPFEIKHFVVALNANVSVVEDALFGAYLTVGYKF